jgi:hypothetical protein
VGEHLALLWGLEVPIGDGSRTASFPRNMSPRHWPADARLRPPLGSPGLRAAPHRRPGLGGRQPPKLNAFLLTPVGAPSGQPNLRLHARRGAYSEGADPVYASIVVTTPRSGGIGRLYALVSLGAPVLKLFRMWLAEVRSGAVAELVGRHPSAADTSAV